MIRISNIKYPLEKEITENELKAIICKILKSNINDILNIKISKKSIDAREKRGGFYVLSLDIDIKDEKKYLKIKDVSKVEPFTYTIPKKQCKKSPVVIGFGPAGLMASLILARSGLKPIIIERGKSVYERKKDIDNFWQSGNLNENSNVQFGEGGAGTFSDGKLTTGIKDYRCRVLLEEFVKASAPEEILYRAKPHIGTDKLITMVKNIREEIISLGGLVLFEHKMINLLSKDNTITGVTVENIKTGETFNINSDNVILAIGHSARDTFELINNKNHPIEKKPFAVGVRVEHSQEFINNAQYGKFACYLPPADYKLAVRLPNNRGAYTFCMCPGGYVVNASSEKNRLVTNGMSYFDRSGKNANSALLIEVYPEDLDNNNILSGVDFQRELEQKAFIAGGGNYFAPVQKIGDILKEVASTSIGNIQPTFKPGVTPSDFKQIFPDFIYQSIRLGLIEMDKKIKGFADENGLLTAIESRSSSPIRIIRDKQTLQSIKYKGLYPCGEGCGYAGGIVSAGVDGIKCAEAIINSL
ncbi:NAD(P)/FAD-dependent oxidoreductase [[Clostridium] colinum]|uniref:NAD(P)/FAD-dependent oxidoreductase n=1 Tax=[Clostridium] colinum TaxID=36835 RepID=UPI002024E2F3|nr:FAD-binding protein [[Clostridium] colinum]